jgi:plastocyanin
MNIRLALATLVAAAGACVFAATASSTSAVAFQVNVTITDTACTLDHPSVGGDTLILFHVVSNGKFSHQFKIWGVSSGIIKAGQEGQFQVKFRKAGRYAYSCWNSHALLKRGVFTLRK